MEFIYNYMRDDKSRHMLNNLTEKVFGFDFEGWVTGGFFEGDYIPYSFVDGGKMVSNVSANIMKFMQNGTERNYIQIGTVMTDLDYRKQGLAAKLINKVTEEYAPKCDGIYLFGNLDALGFYQKMGFKIVQEYRWFVKEEYCRRDKSLAPFKPVADMDDAIKQKYLKLVRKSAPHSSFEQINKYGLQMFYTAGLDSVQYCAGLDCFIVLEDDVLQSVLSDREIALADVLKRIELPNRKCMLGFVPRDRDKALCTSEIYDGADDYRLFYKGEKLESIERDRLYFPDLSHA